jgi:hypothetical protein
MNKTPLSPSTTTLILIGILLLLIAMAMFKGCVRSIAAGAHHKAAVGQMYHDNGVRLDSRTIARIDRMKSVPVEIAGSGDQHFEGRGR